VQLADKSILLISPEPWSHLFVSKHHYAIHLAARRNRVIFLNPPGRVWKVSKTDYENLLVVDYPGFISGLRHFPKFLRLPIERSIFKKIEKVVNFTFDVIWSFDNSVFFDFDALPSSVIKISHIVDLNQDFQFKQAASSANLCLGSTRFIVEKLLQYNPNSYFINHGFSRTKREILEISTNASNLKIGYAGNLDIEYIDWELLQQVVDEHQSFSFYFAGSGTGRIKSGNVHYLGRLSKAQLSDFYAQMDVLIIAYKADENAEQLANPHKILEYLYSGKPIVATLTAEYREMDLFPMSVGNSDWPDIFRQVTENVKSYASGEKIAQRRKFAADNTYEKQIERIEQLIDIYE
jgi:glycosyltransferase involved in cell wall biosynthesis